MVWPHFYHFRQTWRIRHPRIKVNRQVLVSQRVAAKFLEFNMPYIFISNKYWMNEWHYSYKTKHNSLLRSTTLRNHLVYSFKTPFDSFMMWPGTLKHNKPFIDTFYGGWLKLQKSSQAVYRGIPAVGEFLPEAVCSWGSASSRELRRLKL